MLNVKFLLGISSIAFFLIFKFIWQQSPIERQKLTFREPAKSIQDSLLALRQICESVEAKEFMNCYVRSRDSVLTFKGNTAGKIDTVSTNNKAFHGIKKEEILKLLSILKFLNRNFIAGTYHDTSIGFWLYIYRQDGHYNTTTTIRNIYIWNNPQDTLTSSFKNYLKILDRKENMVLVGHNYVPYKRF